MKDVILLWQKLSISSMLVGVLIFPLSVVFNWGVVMVICALLVVLGIASGILSMLIDIWVD